MNSVTKKLQIMESLSALDQTQTEKVLAYIRDMLSPHTDAEHKRNKREALKEIRKALSTDRRLNMSM